MLDAVAGAPLSEILTTCTTSIMAYGRNIMAYGRIMASVTSELSELLW